MRQSRTFLWKRWSFRGSCERKADFFFNRVTVKQCVFCYKVLQEHHTWKAYAHTTFHAFLRVPHVCLSYDSFIFKWFSYTIHSFIHSFTNDSFIQRDSFIFTRFIYLFVYLTDFFFYIHIHTVFNTSFIYIHVLFLPRFICFHVIFFGHDSFIFVRIIFRKWFVQVEGICCNALSHVIAHYSRHRLVKHTLTFFFCVHVCGFRVTDWTASEFWNWSLNRHITITWLTVRAFRPFYTFVSWSEH